MEIKLHEEFLQIRKDEKGVKNWINSKAKQLMQKLYQHDTEYHGSDGWFNQFCRRKNISLRRKGRFYRLLDLANMEQTPLPFVLENTKIYNTEDANEIW